MKIVDNIHGANHRGMYLARRERTCKQASSWTTLYKFQLLWDFRHYCHTDCSDDSCRHRQSHGGSQHLQVRAAGSRLVAKGYDWSVSECTALESRTLADPQTRNPRSSRSKPANLKHPENLRSPWPKCCTALGSEEHLAKIASSRLHQSLQEQGF